MGQKRRIALTMQIVFGAAVVALSGNLIPVDRPVALSSRVTSAPSVPHRTPLLADTVRRMVPIRGLSRARFHAAAGSGLPYDPTSIYDQKGVNVPRGFSAQAPNESIDPFSGNLIIRHVDLSLPGKAGLDLTLTRVYNSKIHRNYAALASHDNARVLSGEQFVPPSPLGLGWSMHLGRLVGAVNGAVPNSQLPGPRYYESPDGEQRPFFTHSGPGCGNGTTDVCLVDKQSDNLYQVQLNPSGPPTWRLSTSNGLVITFGHQAVDQPAGGATVLYDYATEIRDVHANTITINYHDDTFNGLTREYLRHFIDFIIDSVGRRIDFNYSLVSGTSDVVRLTGLTAVGRTYTYSYSATDPWANEWQAFLTRAQPPVGAPWTYEYAGLADGSCADTTRRWCELSHITYPAGGTIDYTYNNGDATNDVIFYAQANPMTVRVVTKRVVGGHAVTPATWTYTYNRAADYSGDDHTIITRPDGSKEISTFFGVGNVTYNPLGKAWEAGVLLKKRILDANGRLLQTETFTWDHSPAISQEIWGDPWIGFDTGVFVAHVTEDTIQRGSLTWATINTSFDENNHTPRCITEQAPTQGTPAGTPTVRYRLNAYQSISVPQGSPQGNFYLFEFDNLLSAGSLSFNAFSSANCDPRQSSTITPAIGDEADFRTFDTATGMLTTRVTNGVRTDYQYNGDGTMKAVIGYQGGDSANPSNGFCTTYGDYQFGMPQTIGRGAAGDCSGPVYSDTRVINQDGSLHSETDGNGHTTTYGYDAIGRLASISPPGEATIDVAYLVENGFNTTRRVTQDVYQVTTHFDGFNRMVDEQSSAGVFARQVYDALGQVQFKALPSEAAGSTAGDTFAYDALGRTLSDTHADSTAITYAYGDDSGAPTVTITDENGHQTVQTRRAFGNPDSSWLVRVQLPGEPVPSADTYTYLVGGALTGVNYAGRQRTLQYDFAKHVIQESNPETAPTFFGYDAAGNLRCRGVTPFACADDRLADPNTDIRYTVDRLQRVTNVQHRAFLNTPDVTFTYDNANNLATMTDGVGTHVFSYTPTNRLQQRVSTINGVAYTTAYGYDSRGNLQTLTYPSGRVVTYGRDAGNRIDSIRDASTTYASSVTYYPNGMPKSTNLGNGISTVLGLDTRQRPSTLHAQGVVNLTYGYDHASNVTSLDDAITPTDSTTLTYDTLDRLTGASGTWGSITYTYDAAGDRTLDTVGGQDTTYTYDGSGQLQSLSGRINLTYGYDGYGNVTQRGAYTYGYDLENRMTSVTGPDNTSVGYGYDGQGQRMIAKRPGCNGNIVYIYDQQGNRIAESTLSGALLKEYIVADNRTIAELDEPPLKVQPASIDFGAVQVNTTATSPITLTNRTSAPLTLSQIRFPFGFHLQGTGPLVVPANTTITAAVAFQPYARMTFDGAMTDCENNGAAVNVALHGKGVAAQAVITPATFDLGDVPLGSVITRTFTVGNVGDLPLHITGWTPDDPSLSIDPPGLVTVPVGSTSTFTLSFDTRKLCAGPYRSSINLESDSAGQGPIVVTANLRGLEAVAPTLSFGPLGVGATRTLSATVINRATIPLTPTISLSGAPAFTMGSVPPGPIPPGATEDVAVTYRPSANLWSPFGDHAMLNGNAQGCATSCSLRVHLIGNAPVETVPAGGVDPAVAIVTDTVHVMSVQVISGTTPGGPDTTVLSYAIRAPSGSWSAGPDPAGGTTGASQPALLAGPNGRLTVLWHEHFNLAQMMLRQRTGTGSWGSTCIQDGRREGWGPLATDGTGSTWLAWRDKTTFTLDAGPIFSASGACLGGQAPPITTQARWYDLTLTGAPGGKLALAGADSSSDGLVSVAAISPASGTITEDNPANSEVGFPVGTNADLVSFGAAPALAVDAAGTWHVVWPEIFVGQSYDMPARYVSGTPRGSWSKPLTVLNGSVTAQGLRVATDSLGGVYMAWTDQCCAGTGERKVYFAVKPPHSTQWQVSDVSSPGYTTFDPSLALALQNDKLVASWAAYSGAASASPSLLFGQTDVGARIGGSNVVTATITPGQGGSLTSTDGSVTLRFPSGAVRQTTTITYTAQTQPTQALGGFTFAGHDFTLTASDTSGAPVTTFGAPYTLTLAYTLADLQRAGITDERTLNLEYWNGTAWVPVLPCAGCSLDTTNHVLTAVLNHFTEFALLGAGGSTATATDTPTTSATATTSPTPTMTSIALSTSATPTRTMTATPTTTRTATPLQVSGTPSATITATPTTRAIGSPSATPSASASPTDTPAQSSATETGTASATPTATTTSTGTATATATPPAGYPCLAAAIVRWQQSLLRLIAIPSGRFLTRQQLSNTDLTGQDLGDIGALVPDSAAMLRAGGSYVAIAYQAAANSFTAQGRGEVSCRHLSPTSAIATVKGTVVDGGSRFHAGDPATVIIGYNPQQSRERGGQPASVEIEVSPGPGSSSAPIDITESPPWKAWILILPS